MSAPSSSAERMLPTRAAVPVIGGFFALFFGFLALPRVRATPGLFWAFIGAGLVMLLAVGALALRDRRSGRRLQIQLWPKREHTVQLVVQLTIFGYWGWYWRPVYEQMPLILAQVVFAYLVDLVLAWRRYGRWRLGLGQFPITFSTNLFMWFRDPLFGFQFAMMALAYLSRDALVWRREGQRTHIFNPSAFGLAIASVTLIIGEWAHQTYGSQIALSLGYPPFAFEWIFLCGVVVQLFFRVTLVTFSAAMAAWVFGAVFYLKTGVWLYVDTAIPIAVFLGMNLLVTDPVSSPRSNGGKVLFGVLYGVAVCVLYGVLRDLGRPATETDPGLHVSWLDKLLFLPVLNLLARPLDAIGRHLNFKRFGWKFGPPATNRVHVALWVGAFVALRPWLIDHPGRSHDFWREACTEGRFRACENLLLLYDKSCESGIGAACHNLGVMVETGEAGPVDLPRAA
ncbi:MAG: hypothetical protein KC620_22550, partial [Myxococcales bacterium]|nr:hypothetical protein [Myxococcales bacterium]